MDSCAARRESAAWQSLLHVPDLPIFGSSCASHDIVLYLPGLVVNDRATPQHTRPCQASVCAASTRHPHRRQSRDNGPIAGELNDVQMVSETVPQGSDGRVKNCEKLEEIKSDPLSADDCSRKGTAPLANARPQAHSVSRRRRRRRWKCPADNESHDSFSLYLYQPGSGAGDAAAAESEP